MSLIRIFFINLVGIVCLVAASPAFSAPGDADALYAEAMGALEAGNYTHAGRVFERAYVLDPSPTLLWNAARAYQRGEGWTKAIALYERFVVMDGVKAALRERAYSYIKEMRSFLAQAASRRAAAEEKARRATEMAALKKEMSQELLSTIRGEAASQAKEPLPTPPPDDTTWGWVAFSGGAALTLSSLTLLAFGQGAQGRARDPVVDLNGVVVGQTQTEAADAQSSADAFHTASLVTGLAGGIALVSGVLLLWVLPDPPAVGLATTEGGATLLLGGAF